MGFLLGMAKRSSRPNVKPKVRTRAYYCRLPLNSLDLCLIDVPTVLLHSTTPGTTVIQVTSPDTALLAASTSLTINGPCLGCATLVKMFVNHIKHRHGIGWQQI